ncbi:MAG: DsbE family thiol:disulfide interchange protein [Hyphomicrobiaceae bacterium]|nr:DsbE family thiol:disulfide interchange protein [Hyphomicrobiaceae bacterium]
MTNIREPAPPSERTVPPASGGSGAPRRRLLAVLLPVFIFAAVAGMFALALQKGDPSRIPSALIGRPAPSMALPPVEGLVRDGQPIPGFRTADLVQGRPAIVNFWASWCLPCVEEHPHLVALAKRAGLPLYGVNHKDEPANARRFLARHGNPYAAVGADANGRAGIEWGVYGMPETFVVDGKGTIVYKHVGPITAESLEKVLLPAVRKAAGG